MPSSREATEFASYVAGLVGELARLARDRHLPTLAYLLEIARLEAATTARDAADLAGEAEREPPLRRRPVRREGEA